jgi:hypothetical protein
VFPPVLIRNRANIAGCDAPAESAAVATLVICPDLPSSSRQTSISTALADRSASSDSASILAMRAVVYNLIKEWSAANLQANWARAKAGEPLERIAPLD